MNNNIINSNFNFLNNNNNNLNNNFNNLNNNIINDNFSIFDNNNFNNNNNNMNNNFNNNNYDNTFNNENINYNNDLNQNNLNENDNNCEDDEIDRDLLEFLIELAPFNTKEEIIEKIYECNYDIDEVISSLMVEVKEDDSPKESSKLKYLINYKNYNSSNESNKSTKRKKKSNKKLNYKIDQNFISDCLRKYSDEKKIDLHGARLPEAMLIVKKKIEMMRRIIEEYDLQNGIKLKIITGKGIHSPGQKPVLRPNILSWLKKRGYSVDESDPGALTITII